jgi:class 3 adenylate cyclase/tetratricopeptide (TPR) repeat protein/regulation of enolase protein 1 (concanavalin A-like superfamily)
MECGTKLENVCPKCGAELRPKAKFCDECGAKLTDASEKSTDEKLAKLQSFMPKGLVDKILSTKGQIEGERKIVTVLFADMQGSSALTQKYDPEVVSAITSDYFRILGDVVYKYEGSIDRLMGDGMMVIFGAPVVHENDPQRAILSALDMQAELKKLNDKLQEQDITIQMRIGINTGTVVVDNIGSDLRMEYTAMGDIVNMASRLEKIAPVGGVLVGESTYRLTNRLFDFLPKPVQIKGWEEAVTAYEVIKAKEEPQYIRGIPEIGRTRFVGRDKELGILKERIAEVQNGKGQVVSIVGEPGIGKTRLVYEFISSIENAQILTGSCLSYGATIAYLPFIDIIKRMCSIGLRDTEESAKTKLKETIEGIDPQLSEDIPIIGFLLSLPFGQDEIKDGINIESLGSEQRKYVTFRSVRRVLMSASQKNPLILVFEDLHWIDSLSMELLTSLVESIANAPVGIIAVYRPEFAHTWGGKSYYTQINLSPLSDTESQQLVESVLQIPEFPKEIRDMILSKSEGNPFFVEEVIRTLIDSGILTREDQLWKATRDIERIVVPDTIQEVIMARIDGLEEGTKRVLQCASVIGRSFLVGLLEKVLEIRENLERSLQRLEHLELIYEKSILPELEYIFKHALTQEVAYDSLLIKRRKEYHERVGKAIEETYPDRLEEFYEVLAYQYSHSDNAEKSVEYLMKAGNKAMRAYSNQEAIGYFNQALEALEELEETKQHDAYRITVLESLGRIYHMTSQYEQADESFKNAFTLAVKTGELPAKLAELQYWRAECLQFIGKLDEAIEAGEIGLSFLGENLVCPQAANIFQVMGFSYNNSAKAEECFSKNAAMIHKLGYFDNIFRIYTGISRRSAYMGDVDTAIAWQEESLRVCQSHGNNMGVAEAYSHLGLYYPAQCELDKALDCLEKSLRLCEQIGFVQCSKESHRRLAQIMFRLGDDVRAEEHLRMAGSLKYFGWWNPLGDALHGTKLARIYLSRGNSKKAIQICTDGLMNSKLSDSKELSGFLGVLEDAYQKSRGVLQYAPTQREPGASTIRMDDFISFCCKLRDERADVIQKQKLVQWYLEPKSPSELFDKVAFLDDFGELKSEWQWIDPRGDCSYSISDGWLELRSASGRNLFGGNLNAPRLVLEISGDFAIETKIIVSEDMPSVGGLLVWKDERNFIRFEKGLHGEHEMGFSSNIDGDWQYYGRGLLVSSITYLRLERSGDTFIAYCSSDGTSWLICGEMSFPTEDPIQVGIHAIGNVGIRGGHNATATRFDYFRVLKQTP